MAKICPMQEPNNVNLLAEKEQWDRSLCCGFGSVL